MTATAESYWTEARAAVPEVAERVSELLRGARRPSAPALGTWDLTGVATHLSHALDGIVAMAEGGGGLLEDIWTLSSLTERLVEGESERDLCVLADRIQASADRLVSLTGVGEKSSGVTWLVQGIELPLPLLACHALSELLVHGRDIAMAEGVPWAIPRPLAVQVVCGFLFPVLGKLGAAMVDQEAAAGVRATYDVRLRGGCRVTVRIHDGDMTLTQGGPGGPADCHLWVDPAAFLLVAWGRVGQWRPSPAVSSSLGAAGRGWGSASGGCSRTPDRSPSRAQPPVTGRRRVATSGRPLRPTERPQGILVPETQL